jgi:integral membrane sensor domain MASE1
MSAMNRSSGHVGISACALAWSFPLLLTVYTPLAAFGHGWATESSATSSIFPAAGVALAGLVLGGVRLWPAISLGTLIALQLVGTPHPAWVELAFALGNGLGAASGALALCRLGFDPALGRLRDAAALLAGTAVAAAPAAAVGAAALVLAGGSPPAAAQAGVAWWHGDAAGMMAVAPLLLAWAHGGPLPREARWWLHLAACLTVTALLAWLAFSVVGRSWVLAPHLLVPLSWAALAFGPRGAAAAASASAAIRRSRATRSSPSAIAVAT